MEQRLKWRLLINRRESFNENKLWSPRKQSRVCSLHFVSGEPSTDDPYPTEELGYNAENKIKSIVGSRRRLSYSSSTSLSSNINTTSSSSDLLMENVEIDLAEMECDDASSTSSSDLLMENVGIDLAGMECDDVREIRTVRRPFTTFFTKSFMIFKSSYFSQLILNIMVTLASIISFGIMAMNRCKEVETKNTELKSTVSFLSLKLKQQINKSNSLQNNITKLAKKIKKCNCETPLHKKLLISSKDCAFYTGIKSSNLFDSLHDIISPYVRRHWRGAKYNSSKITRKFKKEPKRMGPVRKLGSKDEFMLMLMRLRLGLLVQDLSNRFKISVPLTSSIISSWLRASAIVLKSVIFVPDQGILNATKPPHFKSVTNLHSIIDASEIFIQTPKDHRLQKMTWSSYKHHNTMKVLIAVAGNSFILFVSKAFGGSVSDKSLTLQSCFLDTIDPYSTLMVDKGFNIEDECTARRIHLLVPPGRRGQSQMLQKDIAKTNKVAKLRILVEQVIRRFKCFRILANEFPISALSQLDDIIIVCAALTNLQDPIYR